MCESQGQLEFFYVGILTVLLKLLRNKSTLQTAEQTFFIVYGHGPIVGTPIHV
jgi:hypothetical protein